MKELNRTDISEHRDALLDIDVLLTELQKPALYQMEATEAEIIAGALTGRARERLNRVSDWLGNLLEAEAAQ